MLIKQIFNWLINLIYNQNCCVCNNSVAENFLCKNCAKTVEFLPTYAQSKIQDVNIFSACKYEGVLKTLIQNYKFKNKTDIKIPLANFLYKYFDKTFENKNFLIIPVPSYKDRISKRGYAHINLIAEEFCKLSNLKMKKNILIKIKMTKPQYNLSNKERFENIKKSFKIELKNYNNENLLIIDDLTTSGATLTEIINEFHKNNIKNITCLTLCKTK